MTPHEIHETYLSLSLPVQRQIDGLRAFGIENHALIFDWRGYETDLRTARVEWHNRHFEFSDEGNPALIVEAFDEVGDLIDLVCFNSKGRIASWLGNAAVLGGENVLSPRMADGLTVHETGLEWLRDYRRGVVIIDPKKARVALECSGPLIVCNHAHARELRAALKHEPKILIQERKAA